MKSIHPHPQFSRTLNSRVHVALAFALAAVWGALPISPTGAQERPVVSDSRIKTLVYNENDVFRITSHYGFQSNIELGPKEDIKTISLGDQLAWQVVPSGRYIFIRALAQDTRTNMTVITNRHTYQFDLYAPPYGTMQDELSYVVRFYYPNEQWDRLPAAGGAPAPYSPPQPVAMNVPQASSIPPVQPQQAMPAPSINLDYTLSGNEHIAPVKIYDDGSQTFFEFRPGTALPLVSRVDGQGAERPVPQRAQGSVIIVSTVSPRFALRSGEDVVCIFNEAMHTGF